MQSVFSRMLNPYYRVCQHQQYVNTHVFISCMLFLCLCILCTAVSCKPHFLCSKCVFCVCVCTVYTVCMCVCTTWWRVPSKSLFLVFTVVCSHVFFLSFFVFHEFESPGIELATVKVVNLFLNFADRHVLLFYIFLFGNFFVLTNSTCLASEVKENKLTF